MSTLRANKIVGKANQPVNIPGAICNSTSAFSAFRMRTSSTNRFMDGVGAGFIFQTQKQWDDSTLIVDMVIPAWGNTNDGAYTFIAVNGIPYKVGVSFNSQGNTSGMGFRVLTPIFGIQEKYQDHNWSVTYNEAFRGITGVRAGPVNIVFGWSPEDQTDNRDVNVINFNRHEDGRNQQAGTTCVIWEVAGNPISASGSGAVEFINYDIG